MWASASFDSPEQAVRAMAGTLGYMVSNPDEDDGWIHLWNGLGCYRGRVPGWEAAYRLLAPAYVRRTHRPPPRYQAPDRTLGDAVWG
jgi:hypothetical protein